MRGRCRCTCGFFSHPSHGLADAVAYFAGITATADRAGPSADPSGCAPRPRRIPGPFVVGPDVQQHPPVGEFGRRPRSGWMAGTTGETRDPPYEAAVDHQRMVGRGLLQQLREPPVGELLAAGLAGGAVLQRGVGEGHLGDRVTADIADLALAAVHPQAGLLLALEVLRRQALGPLDRAGQLVLDGPEQRC